MTATPRQRWIAAVLTLWGIPATLLWLGLGFYFKVSLQSAHEEGSRNVSLVLDSLAKNSHDFLKNQLNTAFEEFSKLQVPAPDFFEKKAELEKRFPPGLFRFYLFDGAGRILVASETHESLEMGKFFNFIRRPWGEYFPADREYFKGMDRYLPDGLRAAEWLRSQEGEIRVVGQKIRASPHPTWGYYRWSPQSESRVGGMFAFIVYGKLPDDYLLRGGIDQTDSRGCRAGFMFRSGVGLRFFGLPGRELEQVYERYKKEPSKNFSFGRFLGEGRPFDDSAIFFALAPTPEGPRNTLVVLFLLYAICSLLIILKLYNIMVLREPWHLTLGKKLAILFLWGVFFPIGAASSLASLYLQEKRGDILEENRKSAFQVLDRIDQGYEKALSRREQFYHRISKGFSRGTLSIEKTAFLLKKLWEGGKLDDFYIISSQSRLIWDEATRRMADFRSLLAFPPEKRMKYLEFGLRKGHYPHIPEVDCLIGRIPYEKIPPRMSEATREITRKSLSFLVEEIFLHVNVNSGKTVLRKEKSGSLAMKGAMGDDVMILMKFLALTLGQLIESVEASSGYTYSEVLKGPDGEVPYIFSINHSYFTLQNDYLKRELSEEKRKTGDYELRALGNESVYSPDYPREGADQLIPVHDRLEAAKNPSLVCSMTLEGRDVEIAVRRPQNLRSITLFHLTPTWVLDQRLRVFKIQAAIFILVSCFFCFSLGYLLLRKFLVPLYALSEGIRALRKKQFDHRVQVFSHDEIGHLSLALNKTIEHMKNMEMASSLQANLYPQGCLQAGAFEILGKNLMTQAIGGDYFDYFALPDGRVAIILGDVSGHGVSAALVAAMAKSGFSILCPIFYQNPVSIMEKINRQLLDLVKRQKMMSCFLGILDAKSETFTAINAGQCFPVLVDQGGATSFLDLISSPLGMLKVGKFRSRVVSMKDTRMVLYSDGLAEAQNGSGQPLGYDRFAEIACKAVEEKQLQPTDFIFREVKGYTDPVPWGDDATIIVIRKRSGMTTKNT